MDSPANIAVPSRTPKVPREEHGDDVPGDDENDEARRVTKATRHDIELPVSKVDLELAEKLDNMLRISDAKKPRFFLHKLRETQPHGTQGDATPSTSSPISTSSEKPSPLKDIDKSKLKPKCLTKEQLRERLLKKYDTLVPELDPKRPSVRLIKILSAKESLELGRAEAKKQLEHQLELNSVSGNRQAHLRGIGSFRFSEGNENAAKCYASKKKTFLETGNKPKASPPGGERDDEEKVADGDKSKDPKSKSVTFSKTNETFRIGYKDDEGGEEEDEEEDDDDLTDDDDDESDCSTVTASSGNENGNDHDKTLEEA